MRQSRINTKSSVENYLRYGKGQSHIVINDHPEQKGTAEELSAECTIVWDNFKQAQYSHDKVTEQVLKRQKILNQINITIENMLRRIKDPRTGKLLHMAAVLIPLLRTARNARSAINVIRTVGDLLADLLDISALYSPIGRQRYLFAKEHDEFILWRNEMDRLGKKKDRLLRKYNNMNCPAK